jgi:uncharacterized iron-regulated membrane protein
MRDWHRRLGALTAVVMFLIALSGIGLQIEMEFITPARPLAAPATAGDAQIPVERLVSTALAAAKRQTQGSIADFAVRATDMPPTAEVVVLEPQPRRIRFNALTGEVVQAPATGLHRFLLDFHRGALIGWVGYGLSVACGLVLNFFCISGLVMYLKMFKRRAAGGRQEWLW